MALILAFILGLVLGYYLCNRKWKQAVKSITREDLVEMGINDVIQPAGYRVLEKTIIDRRTL